MKQQFKYSISDFTPGSISVKRKRVDADYRLHWHDCCEAELITGGSGAQILNGNEYPLRPGDLYMLTPADCHSIKVYEPLTIVGAMFEERYISPAIYERILTRETLGLDTIARLDETHARITERLFDALRQEHEASPDGMTELGELYAGRLLDCILSDLLRGCSDDTHSAAKSQIGQTVLFIHSHYSEHITLTDVAERAHLSAGYFSEVFKNATGQTFKSYLTGLRMRNACRMLANTDMSVTDICYACGFESFSNFMRAFKKYNQISPLRFRMENQSEKMQ